MKTAATGMFLGRRLCVLAGADVSRRLLRTRSRSSCGCRAEYGHMHGGPMQPSAGRLEVKSCDCLRQSKLRIPPRSPRGRAKTISTLCPLLLGGVGFSPEKLERPYCLGGSRRCVYHFTFNKLKAKC